MHSFEHPRTDVRGYIAPAVRPGIALTLIAIVVGAVALRAQTADMILTNGKIVTVDERFAIVQAVAMRGDRILATGTNQEMAQLAPAIDEQAACPPPLE